uniref:DNA 5'-3' helicase n=1 Tax=viral metagenome TaxID=1070528 RepID=A0A6M3XV07_9ZZZZ
MSTLPNDALAERSLLGCLLLDGSCVPLIAGSVSPKDFYQNTHQLIYEAMLDLSNGGLPVEPLSVLNCLKSRKEDSHCGGISYLNRLIGAVASSTSVGYYAQAVKTKADLRLLAIAGSDLYRDATCSTDPLDVRARHEKALLGVERSGWSSVHISEVEEPNATTGYPTGIVPLDEYTGGIYKGLHLLGGRAGHGKTTLAMQIIHRAATDGHKSCIISADQQRFKLKQIIRAQHAGVHMKHLSEISAVDNQTANELPVYFFDGVFSAAAVCSYIRFQARQGSEFFLIDYLNLLRLPGPERQFEKAEIIAEMLKLLAHEANVYLIAIVRNRKVEDREPDMDDISGGAGIQNAPDQIWWMDKPKDSDNKPSGVFVLKNRMGGESNGPPVRVWFDKQTTRFVDWEAKPALEMHYAQVIRGDA